MKRIDPKEFVINKYPKNRSKYPKELHKLRNYYPLPSDKIEVKREILSYCQLKIADLYNTPIDNVKKLVPKFWIKESMCVFMRAHNYL